MLVIYNAITARGHTFVGTTLFAFWNRCLLGCCCLSLLSSSFRLVFNLLFEETVVPRYPGTLKSPAVDCELLLCSIENWIRKCTSWIRFMLCIPPDKLEISWLQSTLFVQMYLPSFQSTHSITHTQITFFFHCLICRKEKLAKKQSWPVTLK